MKIIKLNESINPDVEAVKEFARDCKELGKPVEDYREFSKILYDEGITATEDLYEIFIDTYERYPEDIDMDESLNESVTEDAEPIEAGPKSGMAKIVNDLIKDEYEAIDGYNTAIIMAQEEGFEDAVRVLTEIQAEENIHVGQLQEVMKLFDPNADKVEDGQEEGFEQLANPIEQEDMSDDELEIFQKVINKKQPTNQEIDWHAFGDLEG